MRWKHLESEDLVNSLLYFSAEPPWRRYLTSSSLGFAPSEMGVFMPPETYVRDGGTMWQCIQGM